MQLVHFTEARILSLCVGYGTRRSVASRVGKEQLNLSDFQKYFANTCVIKTLHHYFIWEYPPLSFPECFVDCIINTSTSGSVTALICHQLQKEPPSTREKYDMCFVVCCQFCFVFFAWNIVLIWRMHESKPFRCRWTGGHILEQTSTGTEVQLISVLYIRRYTLYLLPISTPLYLLFQEAKFDGRLQIFMFRSIIHTSMPIIHVVDPLRTKVCSSTTYCWLYH